MVKREKDVLPRIDAIGVPRPDTLVIAWKSGGIDTVTLTGLIARDPVFTLLADPEIFSTAEIISFGTAVSWPAADVDIGADTLLRMAELQFGMTSEDFGKWQKSLGLSNNEAADLLGCGLTTIKTYKKKGNRIPPDLAIACHVLADDPVAVSALYKPRKAGRPKKEPVRKIA